MSNSDTTNGNAAIRNLLYSLGITERYAGFVHLSYALHLTVRQPEQLAYITKDLYPTVARRYHTNWRSVERNIRTVIDVAWGLHPDRLSRYAGYRMAKRPCASQFMSILTSHLRDLEGSQSCAEEVDGNGGEFISQFSEPEN